MNANTQAAIAKLSKCSTFKSLQFFWCMYVRENDKEKNKAILKLWRQSMQNTVHAIKYLCIKHACKLHLPIQSLATHCMTISTGLRPESPTGRYGLLCRIILFNRLASVGTLS